MVMMAKRTPEDVAAAVRSTMVKVLGDLRADIDASRAVMPAHLADDAKLYEDLSADSLDRIELVMALEEEFGVSIDDADVEKLTTVGETIAHVQGLVAAKQIRSTWGKS